MRIIPAIDLIEGKCVRLSQGDFGRKAVYNESPLEVAKTFEGAGLRFLHLVDLDGAKAGRFLNWRVLEAICTQTGLQVDTGGGIRSEEDLRIVFSSGAAQANVGSAAVSRREDFLGWLAAWGAERILLSADAREGKVAIHGWQESSGRELADFLAEYAEAGVRYAVCTDISRDGMMAGPAADLYARIRQELPALRLVASGGISSLDDLDDLAQLGLDGAIVGKALYEGALSPALLAQWQALP
jgi:phosphoribosylformimino-5-aminoimidazole carboxamide ribotide isomerase